MPPYRLMMYIILCHFLSYRVSEKTSNGQPYGYNEANEILQEIYKIKQSLQLGTYTSL